jgi:multimeric flavodoxin WrbA
MKLKALFLNCTLKQSPMVSNTQALINKVVDIMSPLGVESEIVRVADHMIPFGVSSNEGEGDEWPMILEKIKAADIIIIGTPIWFGVRSSIAQMVMERLDGTYTEGDTDTGQFPLYSKVGGVIVTGNEDGAHDAAGTTLFNLSHLGCTIPPNSDCYWVGDAGPGPSYIEAGGENHMYTNKTARYMAHNLVYLARLLKKNPIPTNINKLIDEARVVSHDECPNSHGTASLNK